MTPVVATRGLTRRFGAAAAVDSLTFTVNAGEIFGLVGPDGAGKTTTLRLLVGVLDPSDGDADVLGVPLYDIASVRSRTGYMSQRFGLYEDLTVSENMRFFADLHGLSPGDRNRDGDRLLSVTGLTPFSERLAGRLSGGMKQKLGLACALLHRPEILFLDEPTAGVDPVSRREFWRLLYGFVREGVTIVIATSYMDEAERCGRLAMIYRGRLMALDTPEGVRASAGDAASLDAALAAMAGVVDA